MSMRIGIIGGAAYLVEEGPDRTAHVAAGAPVDGQVVTLPNGREVKRLPLSEFESLFTTSIRPSEMDVLAFDPAASFLAEEAVRQIRAEIPDGRAVACFASVLTEPASGDKPGTAPLDVVPGFERALLAAMPQGCHRLLVDCEATGPRMKIAGLVQNEDGHIGYWSPPAMIGQWLHRQRVRDHHPTRGTWWRAQFEVRLGVLAKITYLVEPLELVTDADVEAAAAELRTFPRSAVATPDWLLAAAVRGEQVRAARQVEPEPPRPPELVRLFDGVDDAGRSTWYRPVLGEREREAVLAYLEGAPLVLSARGTTRDALGTEDVVPMGFHTDGRFVWPSAVAYYLRAHGVPPVPPLVEWIRAARYRLPGGVASIAMDRAVAAAVGRPWDESEVEAKAHRAVAPVEAVIADKRINPRYCSLFAEREGAWCLVRDGDRYRVQWSSDRSSAVRFDDVRQAAAYLAGQLSANAARFGPEPGERVPAWQSPLVVLSDDPPVESFAGVTPVVVEDIEVDRYGEPDGNLVFAAGTPFDQRGLPAGFASRPLRRYRLTGGAWQVAAVTSAAGGRGYVLPRPISEYLRSGHLVEVTRPDHPGLPPITDAMRAEAARNPGGWVYCADPDADPRVIEGMPPPVLLGGYKVGEDGRFTGETYLNEDYRPSPRRRGYPEPQTFFELVLGYAAAGWLPHARLPHAFLRSSFIVEPDGTGNPRIGVDANGTRFLAVHSSPRYVPQDAPRVTQAEGRALARTASGITVVVNPGTDFGTRLPGDDLARAATQHP
ncbi:glycohydrolase toxin TNT-related protein [Actinokineospora sp. PR83]|uniref:glycohydrolase toxin TNT-related protein n=1 Tax=Actinokineospora sp. PR83 TaxID=2884908 RepID=UPI001F1B2323|nr:glycohydrolase toxin TNT-related protein [Actinokineospora sp. PR83]MCG8914502.1 glycohydrolase toxin TNT-related protein [Actinokineospora sp. PR83]